MVVSLSAFSLLRRDEMCYVFHFLRKHELVCGLSDVEHSVFFNSPLRYDFEWVSQLFGGTPVQSLHMFGLGYLPNSDLDGRAAVAVPYGEVLLSVDYINSFILSLYRFYADDYYQRRLLFELRILMLRSSKPLVQRWYSYLEDLLLMFDIISYRIGV